MLLSSTSMCWHTLRANTMCGAVADECTSSRPPIFSLSSLHTAVQSRQDDWAKLVASCKSYLVLHSCRRARCTIPCLRHRIYTAFACGARCDTNEKRGPKLYWLGATRADGRLLNSINGVEWNCNRPYYTSNGYMQLSLRICRLTIITVCSRNQDNGSKVKSNWDESGIHTYWKLNTRCISIDVDLKTNIELM